MKTVKITKENAEKITQALADVNGKARAHTYTDFQEIESLVKMGETRLESLGVAKKDRAGAFILATSGGAVSNSYNNKGFFRVATFVQIERKSSDWFIVKIAKREIAQKGGSVSVCLTKEQKAGAVSRFADSIPAIA